MENNKKRKKIITENFSKRNITVYLVLRILVILTLIRQCFLGNWNNVFLCVLTLILFLAPAFIDKKLDIQLPDALQVIILLFIYAAEILGEINEFYIVIKHWDTILHTINGFLAAGIGFSLIDLLNENNKNINLSPVFVAIVAFCFSMTIGVLWEFFEYGADTYFRYDMQKDYVISSISTVTLHPKKENVAIKVNGIDHTILYDADGNELAVIEDGYLDIGIKDTMKDLFVNFIGAVAFSVIGYVYIKDREKYKFADNFIPKKVENIK